MTDHWHVIRVWSGKEFVVANELKQLDGFVPIYQDPLRGQLLPFTTGYVFARWVGQDPYLWHEIKAINSVFGFIGEPWPIDVMDPIVDRWFYDSGMVTLDETKKDYLRGFSKGDLVILNDNSYLHGHVGVCVWTGDEGAKIKIGLLGREHELYRTFDELTPVSTAPEQDSENKRKRRRRQVRSTWSRQTRMVVA